MIISRMRLSSSPRSPRAASVLTCTKFQVYQRSGVREYLVWRVLEQAVDWFVLRAGHYERLVPDARGVLRSEVFPGLWLDACSGAPG